MLSILLLGLKVIFGIGLLTLVGYIAFLFLAEILIEVGFDLVILFLLAFPIGLIAKHFIK